MGIAKVGKAAGAPIQPLAVSKRVGGELLGVGKDVLYDVIKSGKVRTVTIGLRELIVYADLLRFIEENAKVGLDPAKQEKLRTARGAARRSAPAGA